MTHEQPTLFDQLDQQDQDRLIHNPHAPLATLIAGMTRAEVLATQGIAPVRRDLTINPTRLARSKDTDTAQEAASNASSRGPSQRERVWQALKQRGDATDYELSIDCGILRSSAAKRRQELVDLGYVVPTPFRRKTDTGSNAVVWRLSLASGDYSA
jgi:hypothetical protein